MTEPTELLPCPFCGAAAHFEMDEGRWEWVECESCGMQGNRSASLMEDCKPKLAEEWNRRTPPAVAGWQLVPKALDANMHAAMDRAFADAMHVGTPVSPDAWGAALAAAPATQPTQAQAGAITPPPIECNTEELKRAYAFGWWSALEKQRETAQAGAVPLTDGQAKEVLWAEHLRWMRAAGLDTEGMRPTGEWLYHWLTYVRAIERAHGIGIGIKGGQHGADK